MIFLSNIVAKLPNTPTKSGGSHTKHFKTQSSSPTLYPLDVSSTAYQPPPHAKMRQQNRTVDIVKCPSGRWEAGRLTLIENHWPRGQSLENPRFLASS